jgi:hypothetical protein
MIDWLSKIYGFLKGSLRNIANGIGEINDKILELFGIQDWLNALWGFFGDLFYALGGYFINEAAEFIEWVAEKLPVINVPHYSGNLPEIFITTFNWIFPFSYAMQLVEVFITASILMVTTGALFRWARLIA